MGNTQLPQAGAAGVENSRDTRRGVAQLTDEQSRATPPDDPVATPDETTPADSHAMPAPGAPLSPRDRRTYEGYVDSGHSPADAT